MKRALFLVALSFVTTLLSAQVVARGLKGSYNVENYPEVSFVWNSANPNVIDQSQFLLTDEENQIVDFDFQVLENDTVHLKKSVLFLWEDMYSHRKQSEFTRELLSRFFGDTLTLNASDKFNIAVFNRKRDGKPTINTFLNGFSSNASQLEDVVNRYAVSRESFSYYPEQSDLYLAINEGIDLLTSESAERSCFLVVITAGLNIKASGASTEMETIRIKAVRAGIPIYVVKYNYASDTPEVNALAESTFGLHTFSASNNIDAVFADLQGFYQNFDNRYYGHDYKITFKTKAKRDGKVHPMYLSIGKIRQPLRPFTAPERTFGEWVIDNILLVVVLVAALIAVIILVVLLVRRNHINRDKKMAETEAAMQASMQAAMDEERAKSNQAIEDMRQQQEMERQQKREEEARKAQEEEETRLANLMQTKNLYPRLQCQTPDSNFAYTIVQTHTKIGRNEGNDLVIAHPTVSGFHAEIYFNGLNFELVNKSTSYTQGIIVNGQLFQQCTLKNGDMIGLGDTVVTFYI